MEYTKPNFDKEWMEALRYREFEKMGKDEWINYAKNNFQIQVYSGIKDVLGNVDLDFDRLDPNKKNRFEKSFKKGKVEIPIAVKFSDNDYDLLGGNTRLAGLIKNGKNPKLWVISMEKNEELEEKWSQKYKNSIDCNNPKGFSQKAHCQGKKKRQANETDASSSGSFEGPMFGGTKQSVIKRKISTIPNFTNESKLEIDEQGIQSSGEFDVPAFGKTTKGRKNPLKIDGPDSIYKSRAVKDKKWPRFGGPKGIYVKVKEKCKKFPYCNQGNTGALEFIKEDQELQNVIKETSKKYGIPHIELEKIVLNEIKQIFI